MRIDNLFLSIIVNNTYKIKVDLEYEPDIIVLYSVCGGYKLFCI